MFRFKECRKCRAVKEIAEFYVHPKMLDKHLNICKTCTKERIKKYRIEHPEILKIQDDKNYSKQKEKPGHRFKQIERQRRWRTKEIQSAHNYVHKNIRNQKPELCENCKKQRARLAHHPNYQKPRDVIWLCFKCHNALLGIKKAEGLGQIQAEQR